MARFSKVDQSMMSKSSPIMLPKRSDLADNYQSIIKCNTKPLRQMSRELKVKKGQSDARWNSLQSPARPWARLLTWKKWRRKVGVHYNTYCTYLQKTTTQFVKESGVGYRIDHWVTTKRVKWHRKCAALAKKRVMVSNDRWILTLVLSY